MVFKSSDISYCSNVHCGETVVEIQQNFSRFIGPVSHRRGLSGMATGLWICASAARELRDERVLADFSHALLQSSLRLTSLNGFPYGSFHLQEVKERVYLPDWSDPARLDYSKDLAELLASCLPDGCDCGAISTLPLGYKYLWSEQKQLAAIKHLTELMVYLNELKQRTGKHILICLEMEPDCVLETTDELIDFFVDHVRPQMEFNTHLAVCYDVCHQAVMYENARYALQRIVDAGIPIGKIQISNALQASFKGSEIQEDDMNSDDSLLEQLSQFREPKYLHQVKCQNDQGQCTGWHDLTEALEACELENTALKGEWRIHFHVPVNASQLLHPQLKTTKNELLHVFDFLRDNPGIRPWLEVETYSWQVLPLRIRPQDDDSLIAGIAGELRWVETELQQRELLSL